jgi:hypothetical protein
MKNIKRMESFQPDDSLDEDAPNLALLEELLFLLVVDYLLIEISIVSKLHDDAG